MGFIDKLQSAKGKKFMGYLYGWGAAIVIVGAMFKIQHWPGASAMLVGGLSIEAIIFFFSAFEPIHEEYKWELVYPELAHGHDGLDDHGHGHQKKEIKKADPVAQELDKLLSEAKIGPELLESLGTGMKNLSEQTSKLTNITDAAVATNSYTENVKKAASTVEGLSESYKKASESLGILSTSNEQGTSFGEELGKASKSLAELNAVYELQLQSSRDQVKASSMMYENMAQLMNNLSESVEDTKRYRQEVGQLAQNLEALNTVYGNMLNAMNYKK